MTKPRLLANFAILISLLLIVKDVRSSNQLSVTLMPVDVSCFGESDGAITSQVSGGTMPYTYQWSNGSTTSSMSGLSQGNYALTVFDATNCTGTNTALVNQPSQIIAQITTDSASCFGAYNGSIIVNDITIAGGAPPYAYSLNGLNFQMGNTFGGLAAGSYTVFIVDAFNCMVEYNVTINAPPAINTSVIVNNATILSNASGSGVSYQWLNCNNGYAPIAGQTGQSFTAISTGSYAVEITQNNCVDTSECRIITIVNIDEIEKSEDFLIYPNPTTGNFEIDFQQTQQEVIITIWNSLGKLMDNKTLKNKRSIRYSIKANPGIYHLQLLTSDNKIRTTKILIMNTTN